MGSDNPSGADNQQGSPIRPTQGGDVTPQRLHAELLAVGAKGLEACLANREFMTSKKASADVHQDEDIVHAS